MPSSTRGAGSLGRQIAVAFSAVTVLFGLLVRDGSVGPPLVAVAGVAERTVPFVAGGVAGAAISAARDASYSAARANSEV